MATRLTIKPGKEYPVIVRHPWVFSGALTAVPEGLRPGEPVELYDSESKYLAGGYFNSYSQIAVRIWSYEQGEDIDRDFFIKKVKSAYGLRRNALEPATDAYRLINGEGDMLPGLIVDKYGGYLVVQFHNRGIESWRETIIDALKEVLRPKGIVERSESRSRRIEDLEAVQGVIAGEVPDRVVITENGLKFAVDLKTGQKTGFFLDQRDKRLALMKYAKGKKVLNAFSYSGGFSVYALAAGAEKVVNVDVSQAALDLAEENFRLNGLEKMSLQGALSRAEGRRSNPEEDADNHGIAALSAPRRIARDDSSMVIENIKADAMDFFRNTKLGEYDIIILDPPAFIKDRHKVKEGLRGYGHINEAALRNLAPGGLLVTCSCSAHLTMEEFRLSVSSAASRAGKTVQILETFTNGLDHPVPVAMTETEYLKVIFAKVA